MRNARVCKTSQSAALSSYLDGALDGEALRRIARHVESCDDCLRAVRQLGELKNVMRGVRSAPTPVPGPGFWSDTFRSARLSADQKKKMPALPTSLGWIGNSRWRIATLAGIGVAAVTLALLPIGPPHGFSGLPAASAAPSIDVNALVNSHASLTSDEPLADHSRLAMVVSDTLAQQAGGNTASDSTDNEDLGAPASQGALDAGPETD